MPVVIDGSGTSTFPTVDGTTMLEGGVAMPRMVLDTAKASTSGTSVDFTGIPSWVKRITVMFSGVSTNGTSNPLIQIGTGGVLTTSGYVCNGHRITGTPSGASFTTGFGINASDAANILRGVLVISLLGSDTWVCQGAFSVSTATATFITTGGVTLGGSLDVVRITTVNGTDTFDAGTINILYEG